jgi:hypothetical protein
VIVKRNRTTTTLQTIDVPDTTTPRFGNNKSKVVIRRKFGINRTNPVPRVIDEENSGKNIKLNFRTKHTSILVRFRE